MTLEELREQADSATEPRVIDALDVSIGGVDPLGLRQINFDMMDQVLPGLNNVARHVQPLMFMTWSWRRAEQLTDLKGPATVKELRDFVDRLETIYAWSQFLQDRETDLPGGQALSGLLQADEFRFGGASWERFRDVRRYSTGLIAAVNYGPILRNMEWLLDLSEVPERGVKVRGAYKANPNRDPVLEEALDRFEESFADVLSHPAFNDFGEVTVTREDALAWGALWHQQGVSADESNAAWKRMLAGDAGHVRKVGFDLIKFAATYQTNDLHDEATVRRIMADTLSVDFPEHLRPPAEAWRRVQVRQVFRLALEGLLHWCQYALERPRTTDQLAARFLEEAGVSSHQAAASDWLHGFSFSRDPTQHLDALNAALADRVEFARAFIEAVRFCVSEAPSKGETFERSERLPIIKAAREWSAWAVRPPLEFVGRIIEGWILAQHTYWSVGRGLQDARANGKTILRMRVFIDEGGWRLADGFSPGSAPNPTPDRLGTALSLMRECGELPSGL